MTRLCVSIFVQSIEQTRRDIATAVEAGADIVELRLDHVTDQRTAHDAAKASILPCIATCRPVAEGGFSTLADHERIELLNAAEEAGALYCDVDLQTLRRSAGSDAPVPGKMIVSSHFSQRPAKLYQLVEEILAADPLILKIAWIAKSIRENLEAFELMRHPPKATIALCMGEAGLLSRVLAKKFNAYLTYVSLRPTEVTAPGQPTIEQIKQLYRWDAINPETSVYGVVGSPVAHSLSPAVHNAAFEAAGENAVYLPMLVNPGYESFKAFMEEFLAFKPLDLRGLSITMPHKENALRYLREKGAQIDPIAKEAGAVNTIAVTESGIRGFNTDSSAIVETITSAMNVSRDALGDFRIAVIGAGGTARTAVAALAKLGATVVVYNRTRERADALASEFDGKTGKVVAARLEKLCDSCCHVFINTTPTGMHPDIDASPLGQRLPAFTQETLVFDTIYNPVKTKLLTQAEQAGAKTVGGAEMFLRQAAKQFEIWTKKPAPENVMRRAFELVLGASR